MDLFTSVFIILVILVAGLRWSTREQGNQDSSQKNASFTKFQWNFLIIYYIVMGADWLQGPYVYALYEEYGFERGDIAALFIAGFLSSGVFGTFVGSLADKYGRKLMCVAFGVFYSISCLTKLINNFGILMIGRILSGIATSLLFSSFEAWMISEHKSRGFPANLLSETFSLATFGNGVVAIVAGLVAGFVADAFGYVSPFMVSLVLLILSSFIVGSQWSENYGDSSVDVRGTFNNAIQSIKSDPKIPLLGIIQSLFEASMYTFVFMWTPALSAAAKLDPTYQEGTALPFGLIFASYMVCIMIGSTIFGVLIGKLSVPPENIARILLAIAALSLFAPIWATGLYTVLLSFLLFEICCGLYFPTMGTLRGKYIPEHTRAAVMNFFRVPLNFLVVVVLIKVGNLSNSTVFLICSIWLCIALILMNQFKSMSAAPRIVSAVMNFFRVPLNFLVVVVLIKVGNLSNSTVFLICSIWLCIALILMNQFKSMSTAPRIVSADNISG